MFIEGKKQGYVIHNIIFVQISQLIQFLGFKNKNFIRVLELYKNLLICGCNDLFFFLTLRKMSICSHFMPNFFFFF